MAVSFCLKVRASRSRVRRRTPRRTLVKQSLVLT